MTTLPVESALEAGVACARELLANGRYVREELPNTELPDGLRLRVEELCDALLDVKHDAFSELMEVADDLESGGDEPAARARLGRIAGWMANDLGRIDPVVDALESASAASPGCRLACVLVTESMANVLGSLQRFRASVEAIE